MENRGATQHLSGDTTSQIEASIQRLNQILPLTANQQSLPDPWRQLHQEILASYVNNGRTLTKSQIMQNRSDGEAAIKMLHRQDLIVCNSEGELIGAYPFTMQEREHQVLINGHRVYSMCAMDALSISPMFDMPVEIYSQCRLSKKPVTIFQKGYDIENDAQVNDTFFGIDWNAASDSSCCADTLCTEMIFICGKENAEQWASEGGNQASGQRDIFQLNDAIDFGAGFFTPLMQP